LFRAVPLRGTRSAQPTRGAVSSGACCAVSLRRTRSA
jgi:hypothetical protein